MNKRWKTSNTMVSEIQAALLVDQVERRLNKLLVQKAQQLNLKIETLKIMPDHVHLFVKASPVDAPHFIVQQLKGYTSRILRQEFPHLRSRLPSLWTRSYYVESIGHISEDTVKRYIDDQKGQ